MIDTSGVDGGLAHEAPHNHRQGLAFRDREIL